MEELAEEDRLRLFERFGRDYPAGATVYTEGDEATECFLIQDGRLRLVKKIRSTERSLTVLRPGDLFGEDALLPGATRTATAVALTDMHALALDRNMFAELLTTNREVAGRLVQQLVRRL